MVHTGARPGRHHEPIHGAAAMQGAVIAFTLQDAAAKWVLQSLPLPAVLALRSGIMVVLVGGVLAARGQLRSAVHPHQPVQVTGRALLIVAAFVCYFTALEFMPLADVVAIFFAAPLVQSVLSWPLLGEAVGWRRQLAIVVGFAGVLIMVGPAGAIYGWPTLAAVAASAFYAGAMVWSRALGPRVSPVQLTMTTNLAYVVVGGAIAPFVWQIPTTETAVILVGMALLAFGGHMGLATAYKLAPVSIVAPLDYTAMPLAVVLGVVIWGDWPTWGTAAGVPLVIGSGAYILWRERRLRRLTAM